MKDFKIELLVRIWEEPSDRPGFVYIFSQMFTDSSNIVRRECPNEFRLILLEEIEAMAREIIDKVAIGKIGPLGTVPMLETPFTDKGEAMNNFFENREVNK